MRKLFSLLVLTITAAPVLAGPVINGTVPEPEVLSLLGIGIVAFMLSRRAKK